jgi:TatD DNase family protein
MIDTHAHLDFENFDQDREEVIQRFFQSGGKAIVNVGVDLETSKKSIALAEKYDRIFAVVGLHPDFFNKVEKEFSISNFQFSNNSEINKLINELKKLAKNKKVVAIGETGLDYFSHTGEIITDEQKENQKKGFSAQIELARELNFPMIVHCRNAWDDLYKIISNYKNLKFVLHCYSGEKEDTKKFLELPNVYFSFSGNITYPKPIERANHFDQVIRMIPLDRIMLDSDSPFLAPQEFRGKKNEPAYIRYIAEKIATIKYLSVAEVEKITDRNAENFFSIGGSKRWGKSWKFGKLEQ